MVPFQTLRSEQFGNSYFYRCPEDGVIVVLDFKQTSEGRKQ